MPAADTNANVNLPDVRVGAGGGFTTPVNEAAKKHDVPLWVLMGVWGMETDFGANVKTSSANAMGHFQFIPSTGRAYNYPLTNTPSARQFQQQADAAARYLSDLYKETGSWDEALRRYSGGGYGEAEVKSKIDDAKKTGNPIVDGVDAAGEVAKDAIEVVKDTAQLPQAFYNLIVDPSVWIRIGEAIAGILLVWFGLNQLTGGFSRV